MQLNLSFLKNLLEIIGQFFLRDLAIFVFVDALHEIIVIVSFGGGFGLEGLEEVCNELLGLYVVEEAAVVGVVYAPDRLDQREARRRERACHPLDAGAVRGDRGGRRRAGNGTARERGMAGADERDQGTPIGLAGAADAAPGAEDEGLKIYKVRASAPAGGFRRTDVSRLVLTFGRTEDVAPVSFALFIEPSMNAT